MTHLRQAMLEELHRRNYAPSTITYYVKNVEQFARYFKRSPDRLTPTQLDVLDIVRDCRWGIDATVKFLQHRLTTMGHKVPPVPPNLPRRSSEAYA